LLTILAIMANSQRGMGSQFNVMTYQPKDILNVELDVEKRLTADVLKNRIRIKEFFIDFDRLRKGTVGEAAVRTFKLTWSVPNLSWNAQLSFLRRRNPVTDFEVQSGRNERTHQLWSFGPQR